MVVFDVDGTLYQQSGLRKRMLFKLVTYYIKKPWRLKELRLLQSFRKTREEHAGEEVGNLQLDQYKWCAEKERVNLLSVQRIVEKWIYKAPLECLSQFRFEGLKELFDLLEAKNIVRAIYSDYPFDEKMRALALPYEFGVSSVDRDVNCLKPHPKGLQNLLRISGHEVEECVFIGDRLERDGICAKNAGMPFIIIDPNRKDYFVELKKKISGE